MDPLRIKHSFATSVSLMIVSASSIKALARSSERVTFEATFCGNKNFIARMRVLKWPVVDSWQIEAATFEDLKSFCHSSSHFVDVKRCRMCRHWIAR